MAKKMFFISLMVFSLSFLISSNVAKAQKISKTQMTGNISVTMKVLPAEHFKGPGAEMKWDGGANPDFMNGTSKPNHHLVVFLKKGENPDENASVNISYRELSPKTSDWKSLPVARMHVAGKGLATTHYGNNLWLAKGEYEARVTVNNNPSAIFRFDLAK